MECRTAKFWASIILVLWLVAFGSSQTTRLPNNVQNIFSESFPWALLDSLSSTIALRDTNVVVSPYSVALALLCLMEGTDGPPRVQIERSLGISPGASEVALRPSVRDDLENLTSYISVDYQGHPTRAVSVANGIWVDETFPLLSAYESVISDFYLANASAADFRHHSEQERASINDWVASATNGKIQDLLPPRSVNAATRLVLVSAIHFLSPWLYPFQESLTTGGPFTLNSGTIVTVPTMSQDVSVPTATLPQALPGLSLNVIRLPYKGGLFELVVLLPGNTNQSSDIIQALHNDPSLLDHWLNSTSQSRVHLTMPRFRVEAQYALEETLKLLGIVDVFDANRANFSQIVSDSGSGDRRNLEVSSAVHKTYLDVNEQGTEAAAATAISIGITSLPPELRINRPFVFVLRDKVSAAVLFSGRIGDPR